MDNAKLKALAERMEMQGRALVRIQEFLLEMQKDNAIVYSFLSNLQSTNAAGTMAVESPKDEQPTPVEVEALSENHDAEQPTPIVEPTIADYIGHLVGSGSVFAKYFTPTYYPGGKGFLQPMMDGLPCFQQDCMKVNLRLLAKWPMGFYKNSDSNSFQFYIPMPSHGIIIDGMGTESVTTNLLKPFKEGENIILNVCHFEELSVSELRGIVHSAETILDSIWKSQNTTKL